MERLTPKGTRYASDRKYLFSLNNDRTAFQYLVQHDLLAAKSTMF